MIISNFIILFAINLSAIPLNEGSELRTLDKRLFNPFSLFKKKDALKDEATSGEISITTPQTPAILWNPLLINAIANAPSSQLYQLLASLPLSINPFFQPQTFNINTSNSKTDPPKVTINGNTVNPDVNGNYNYNPYTWSISIKNDKKIAEGLPDNLAGQQPDSSSNNQNNPSFESNINPDLNSNNQNNQQDQPNIQSISSSNIQVDSQHQSRPESLSNTNNQSYKDIPSNPEGINNSNSNSQQLSLNNPQVII